MEINPIAYFRSPLKTKFGVPRQGGVAPSLQGRIVFEPAYRQLEGVRGLEGFSHLWLIWEFSANRHEQTGLTVRPPRLGGNERVGVFASRSPYRPNRLGLTCVVISRIENHPQLGPVIHVLGADLMDNTPIYDVKPYIPYADCHPDAIGGFVEQTDWHPLEVVIPKQCSSLFLKEDLDGLCEVLSQDPRPHYHDNPDRIYGMPYAGRDVRFRVENSKVYVVEIV
jgi:tRNA-Thr(GGU) m(6)t(6)A37 methyltransferase TsaA